MQKRRGWIWLIAGTVLFGTPASAQDARKLFAMTPEQFAAKVAVKDDQFETEISFNTEAGWRESPSDAFLRAYVDKTSGKVTYQLYQIVRFRGDWPFYRTINYYTPEGLREGELSRIHSDVDCGAIRWGGSCSMYEHVGFELPEALVRYIASVYKPNTAVMWKYKLKGRFSDGDHVDGIMPAEAAGLLAVVDRYRASRGLAALPAPTPQSHAVEAAPTSPAVEATSKPQPTSPAKPAAKKKRPGITCVTCN